jgi:dolichyldiphosphatase
MFLGQLTCEAINFVLKRLIKEERPRHWNTADGAAVARGYGMPSSHAQFAVFWAVAVSLFLLVRHRPVRAGMITTREAAVRGDGQRKGEPALSGVYSVYRTAGLAAASAEMEAYSHTHWTLAQRAVVSACALLVAALVAWSRVYLGYHSVKQVLAGCAAGAGCAAAWFAVTYLMRETGMLAWALELPLARWFRVRDLVVVEDLCQAGWEKWEDRRRVALGTERERVKEKERKGQ